jgi:nucleotide-binding universal stress UspA family protein
MPAPIKRIILATDFSDTSKDASYHALLLAKTYKAELKALHVFDISILNAPSSYYLTKKEYTASIEHIEEIRKRGKNTLKKLAESFDLEAGTIFTEGDPGQEIIRVAEELNADLIVLGTHGYTGWKRFKLGSVSEFVVSHAPCAVFIIRPELK